MSTAPSTMVCRASTIAVALMGRGGQTNVGKNPYLNTAFFTIWPWHLKRYLLPPKHGGRNDGRVGDLLEVKGVDEHAGGHDSLLGGR